MEVVRMNLERLLSNPSRNKQRCEALRDSNIMQLHLITKTITEASSRTINCHGSHCKLNENQNKNSVYRDVCLATASPTLN